MENNKPFVRSIYNLGDYNDDEKNDGVSEVEPSHDTETKNLIERVMRGEALNARFIPEYDIEPGEDTDEAFNKLDITKTDGFDLADVPAQREHKPGKKSHQKKSTEDKDTQEPTAPGGDQDKKSDEPPPKNKDKGE